ncbi:acyltransferase family protein [Spirosoma daeguense]
MVEFLSDPLSPFPALCIMAISLLTITVISRLTGYKLQKVKYVSFDGLKGYLSVIVFISHSSTWYYFLRTDKWLSPPSNLFAQVGFASIAIFFMITSFLFCNKLMISKTSWISFYVGRIVRLFPLYFISMLVLFLIVAYLTDFTMKQHWFSIVSQARRWLMFTVKNDPDINGLENTWIIICKVAWTLRYEWLFYILLPIISLVISKDKPNYYILLVSTCTVAYMIYYWGFAFPFFSPFIGGFVATLLSKSESFSKFSTSLTGSIVLISLLILLLGIFALTPSSLFNLVPLSITTIIFSIIVSGNTVFGILSNSSARKLGQVSYGIYLFHGIFFFTLFKLILGYEKSASLPTWQHWSLLFIITPLIITFSYFLHIYIEMPALKFAPLISQKLNERVWGLRQKMRVYWRQALNS